jgi:BirA family biotin operon repressor/biotin-[acetyl-CoA-carboxylase] ligase
VAGDRVEAVVVGLGVNVAWPIDLPRELSGVAVALNHLGAGDVDRGALLTEVLVDLEDRLVGSGDAPGADAGARAQWQESIWRAWRGATSTLGRRVTVHLADGEVTGRAVDITANGHLVVDTGDGTKVFDVGDVVHLR